MTIKRMIAIQAVLQKHDPQGLLRMGTPDDEYDDYARFIFDKLDDGHKTMKAVGSDKLGLRKHYSEAYFRDLVYATFVLGFGLEGAGHPADYYKIADEIREWWLKDRRLNK